MLKKLKQIITGILSFVFIALCCTGLFSKINTAYAPSISFRPPDTVLMCDDSIAAYWKRLYEEKKKFRNSKHIRDEQRKGGK